eukprot:scaffold12909_cov133-Skeletonema_marinoi.AAC.10
MSVIGDDWKEGGLILRINDRWQVDICRMPERINAKGGSLRRWAGRGRASRIISEIEGEHRDGNGRVGESSGGFVFIHLEKMHGNSSRKNWPANDGRPTVPWPTFNIQHDSGLLGLRDRISLCFVVSFTIPCEPPASISWMHVRR